MTSRQPRSAGDSLRRWTRRLAAAGLALCLAAVAVAQDRPAAPESDGAGAEPAHMIELSEGIVLTMMSAGGIAYRIEAESGRLDEDSRAIWMDNPDVTIFNGSAEVGQRISGRRGRVWPVKFTITPEGEPPIEVTKYDWALEGDVHFTSAEGYRIVTPELVFDSRTRKISSSRGVSYDLPAGDSVFSGVADNLTAIVDGETGTFTGWLLEGGIELSSRKRD